MRRAIASVAAGSLLIGIGISAAQAADSVPAIGSKEIASAQPRFSGYRLQEIKDWSPETDPYSEYLRSAIPLQQRIAPLQATQANPTLDGKAEVMLMQGDYGNAFFDTPMVNNDFANHTLNFWQYVDYFSPWHGAATASTPSSLYDPATSDWRNRGFEFGIVNIPNPAYTNAAHRNGVKSIATIYFDPAFRPGQTFKESFDKDPNSHGYVIAQKLKEMAEYYGFDGYFLNQEEGGDDSEFKPFMAWLTAQGLYTQWYDTNSTFNAAKKEWLSDETNGQIHDSVFVNYGWPYSVNQALSYAAANDVDPYKEVFFGVEANQAKFSGSHTSSSMLPNLYAPGTKSPRGSVALFTPSDYYQRGLDDDVKIPALTKDLPLMQQDEFQWMIAERERMYFSGVKQNPRDTGTKAGFARADVGVKNASGWVGVADFTPERSVIGGTEFSSTFNTGHGMQWFSQGKATDGEWTAIDSQSLLPSWQWWVDTEGARPKVDFDYGDTLTNKSTTGTEVAPTFTQVGGYQGGSSLVVHGDLSAPTTLRLFKTDLAVEDSSKLSLTFKKTSSDAAAMRAALIFADAPDQVVPVDLPDTTAAGDWTTSSVDLTQFAGRKIATIGLQFDAATGYQINVGAIGVTAGAKAPAKPSGLSIGHAYSDGQAELTWDAAGFDTVDRYELTAIAADGTARHIYTGYAALAYAKVAPTEGVVRYELRAIGHGGAVSEPATVSFDFSGQPSKVTVAEAASVSGLLTQAAKAGEVTLSWTPGGSAGKTCRVDLSLVDIAKDNIDDQPYGTSVPCADGAATVPVPVAEGYSFLATVTAGDGPGVAVRGATRDTHAQPMPLSDFTLAGQKLALHTPSPKDWWKLSVKFATEAGAETTLVTAKRGDNSNRGLQNIRNLPAANGTVIVTVTDYSGNTVEQRLKVAGGELVRDTMAPVFTVTPSAEVAVELGSELEPITVAVTDDSPVTLRLTTPLPEGMSYAGGVLSGTPALGTHVIGFDAVDWYGNLAHQDVTITVADTTGPTLTATPPTPQTLRPGTTATPVTFAATDLSGPVTLDVQVPKHFTATKRADGSVVVTGKVSKPGRYEIVATATDAFGNTSTVTVPIEVKAGKP